ncbi:MAG: M48 family metallopeptidase [Planctomycetota bacterium]|nr:M48 family metallopeptidase [Planctomycetota bacterium]
MRHRPRLRRACLPVGAGLLFLGLSLGGLGTGGCSSVPYTERAQLRLLPEAQEVSMGVQAYQEILKDKSIETGSERSAMIERIGRRLAAVSGKDYAWEFKLVQADDTVNAFCLPGGKIAVYTGILPYTQNEDGLAAVMGHEIAHAIARHGAERVSQQVLTESALTIVQAGLGQVSPAAQGPVMAALGVGTEVGIMLPYSRLHEHEADTIGLRLMVRAGYNPHEAVRLWERMATIPGERPPPWMSTHPEPRERAQRIAGQIPAVLAEERRAAPAGGR